MLASLQTTSHTATKVESQTYDYMCPLLANICQSIDNFHRKTTETVDTLGRIGPDYLRDEDFRHYTKNIYFESLYYDEHLTEEKDRLQRSGEVEFSKWKSLKESDISQNKLRSQRQSELYNSQGFKKARRHSQSNGSSRFPKEDMDDDFDLDFIPDGKILFHLKEQIFYFFQRARTTDSHFHLQTITFLSRE